jgi:hypothetical protein
MSGAQSYYVAHETPVFESPHGGSAIAEGGTARLKQGTVFVGTPDANNAVHLNSGLGFVPMDVLRPCAKYQASEGGMIYTGPDTGVVANGGRANFERGTKITATPDRDGWLWIVGGTGFVQASLFEPIGPADPRNA